VTEDVPAAWSTVPLASAANTFTTQLDVAPAGTGSGGPKKQRASALQSPGPPQSVSLVQLWVGLRVQWRVANGPKVQLAGPAPASPARCRVLPVHDVTSNTLVGPSGLALAGVAVFPPPPT
jgi:hypothetical protein